MGRTIDADELLRKLEEHLNKKEQDAKFTGDREIKVSWNDAVEIIKEMTDAPKQEIVKCGDCIYYSCIDMLCIRPTEVAGVFTLENEWCKYGKRRTK